MKRTSRNQLPFLQAMCIVAGLAPVFLSTTISSMASEPADTPPLPEGQVTDDEGAVHYIMARTDTGRVRLYVLDRTGDAVGSARYSSSGNTSPTYFYTTDDERVARIRYNNNSKEIELFDEEGARLYRIRPNSTREGQYDVLDSKGKRVTKVVPSRQTPKPRYIGDNR